MGTVAFLGEAGAEARYLRGLAGAVEAFDDDQGTGVWGGGGGGCHCFFIFDLVFCFFFFFWQISRGLSAVEIGGEVGG